MKPSLLHLGGWLLAGLGLVAAARAELWRTAQWAGTAVVTGTAGYDSNLTASRDGIESAFADIDTVLVAKRFGSTTRLEVQAALSSVFFETDELDPEYNPSLSAEYAYPDTDDGLARRTAAVRWRKATAADPALLRRVDSENIDVAAGMRFLRSGKLGFRADGRYGRSDFSTDGFNTNQLGTVILGLIYEKTPRTELSVNLISSWGESEPSAAARPATRAWEQGLTFQARGSLSPKVTSTLFAGVGTVRYRGAQTYSTELPIAGGRLDWQVTPRGVLALELAANADFSPEGDAVKVSSVRLSLTQALIDSWSVVAHVRPAREDYRRALGSRRDDSLSTGIQLGYRPSQTFSALFSVDYTDRDSTQESASHQRTLVATSAVFRF